MTGYARTRRERRRARPLYLELCALGLELWVEDDPDEPLRFRVLVSGLCSLSPSHADRVVRRVRENEVGLARILLAGPWTPSLEAIREEGSPC